MTTRRSFLSALVGLPLVGRLLGKLDGRPYVEVKKIPPPWDGWTLEATEAERQRWRREHADAIQRAADSLAEEFDRQALRDVYKAYKDVWGRS